MSNQKQVFLHFILILFSNLLLGQNSDKPDLNPKLKGAIPSSPSAAALGQYGSSPVSLHTGVPSISIPLFNLTANKISLPISLDYHASGIKVGQIASNVGLGWSLNAGGVITREVRDQPDDAKNIKTEIFFCLISDFLSTPKFTCSPNEQKSVCDHCATYSQINVDEFNIGYMYNYDFVNAMASTSHQQFKDFSKSEIDKLFGDAFPPLKYLITAPAPPPSIPNSPSKEMIVRELIAPFTTPPLYKYHSFKPIPRLYDSEPDIFNFNFAGYTGQFAFHNGQFRAINDQDLKITYTTIDDNILANKNLPFTSMFNGGINSFTIRTPNGYSYIFRDKEISINSSEGQSIKGDLQIYAPISDAAPPLRINREYSTTIIENEKNRAAFSSWYLSEIKNDMEQTEYKLEYADELIMDQSQVSQSFNGNYELKITNTTPITINLTKRVKKINYFTTDGSATNALPTGFVEFNTVTADRLDLYYPTRIISNMGTNYKKSKGIGEILWTINNGTTPIVAKSFALNFDYFNKTDLTLPTTPAPYLSAHRERLRLASVQEIGSDNTTKVEPYIFSYNETKLPPRHSAHQDFWGYYNGNKSSTLLPQVYIYKSDPLSATVHNTMYSSFRRENVTSEYPVFSAISPYGVHDRTSDLSYITSGVLNKITYPTKGSVTFTYEENEYDWPFVLLNTARSKKGGGIRINKTTTSEGTEKSYEYTKVSNGLTISSGKFVDMPLFTKGSKIVTNCSMCTEDQKLKKSALITSNSKTGINNVIYERVIEKTKSAGKVVHTFNTPATYGISSYSEVGTANYSYIASEPIIKTITYFPATPQYANYKDDLYPFAPKPNLDWTRGLSLTKEYYDEAGILLMKEENMYDLKNIWKIPALKISADAQSMGQVEDPFNQVEIDNAMAKYYITIGDKRILKTTTTSYLKDANNVVQSVKKETNYKYNTASGTHHNPTEINFVNSDNKTYRTKIYYAQDIPAAHPNYSNISTFTNKFMIGVPLQVESYFGNDTKKKGEVIEYKTFATNQFLPYKYSSIKTDNTLALNVAIDEYNADGRPQKTTQDGFTTSDIYTWSSGLLTKKEMGTGTNKQTSTYVYNNKRLLETITDENGQKSKFTYDPLLRTSKIEGKFLDMVNALNPNAITDIEYKYRATPAAGDNYVRTTSTFKETTGDVKLYTKQILDKLGREKQTIKEVYSAINPTKSIMASTIDYDIVGRPAQRFLPFENTATAYTMPSTTTLFAKTNYENSTLGRVLSVENVDGTKVQKNYAINTASEVINFTASSSGGVYYAANTLFKEEGIDENGNKSASFTDFAGRAILSRRYTKSGTAPNFVYNTYADTYNIFDDYSNLASIVPPGENTTTNSQCFQYQYDTEHRLFKKYVPGTDGFYTYHYNDRNLLAITQDPNQATASTPKCIFNKYDEIGRLTDIGLITYPNAAVNTSTNTVSNNVAIPVYDILKKNEYEPNKPRIKTELVSSGANDITYNYTYDNFNRVKTKTFLNPNGLAEEITTDYNWADKITKVTRKHTDFLNAQHTLIDRYTYDHGLRTKEHYHKFDNLDEIKASKKNYTYKDELVELNLGYSNNPSIVYPLQSIDYTYNDRGFLTGINKNADEKISDDNQYYYQCSNNYTPTTPVALPTSGEYSSPDVFMEQLYYNEKDNGYLGSSKQYNGNIQAITYQVFGVDRQAFGYAYDDINRMYRAQYGAIDNSNNLTFNSRYNETLNYDPRGNISWLRRNGTNGTCVITNPNDPNQQLPVYSFAPIDNLVYKYNSIHKNRLEKITESALTNYGFKVKSGVDQNLVKYEYDKNGNLIKDPYKKITNIAYNYLNLPISITFDDVNTKSILTFNYDASGQKWQKQKQVYRKNNPLLGPLQDETYYYCNGIEYRAGSQKPDIIQTEEGRLVWTTGTTVGSGSYKYEYAIRDHLGNTRVMVSDKNGNNKIDPNTEITQVNHYYAFGMNQDGPWLAGNKGDNKYQYNGKEFNDDFGLDWNDYGARFYDATIARWNSPDPLAEKYQSFSPFVYGLNNPIRFVDVDGMQTDDWVRGVGDKVFFDASITNARQAADKGLEYLGKEITATDSKGVKYLGDNTGGISQLLDEVNITGKHVPQSDQDYAQNIGETMGSTGPFAAFTADVIGGVFSFGATTYVGAAAVAVEESTVFDASKVIHAGQQGKHIIGHNNYEVGRSVLTKDAQGLLNDFHLGNINSQQAINSVKTRVDFGKNIGNFVEEGISSPTTNGIMHSSKKGIHIVPSAPH